jgi:hypothetical protein
VSALRFGEPRLAAMVEYLRVRQALSGRVPAGRGKERERAEGVPRQGEERRLQGAITAVGGAAHAGVTYEPGLTQQGVVETAAPPALTPAVVPAAPTIEEPMMEVQDG